MPVWIPTIPDLFGLYRVIYWVLASNWILEQNKSFDLFTNFWETRRLRRSRERRRGFCKTRFNRHCCCRTPKPYLLLLLLLLLLSLALTPRFAKLFLFFPSYFSILPFGFHHHVNVWWKFKMRWEVKGLIFIFTLYPHMVIWPSEKTSIHTYGLGLRSRAIPRVLHGVQ